MHSIMAEFVRVCRASDVPDPGKEVFQLDDDTFVVVFHVGGKFYVIDDRCTHDDGPLGEGKLEGFSIVCPRHGAKFDIRDGRALTMPATRGTPAYEVKIQSGDVYIRPREG